MLESRFPMWHPFNVISHCNAVLTMKMVPETPRGVLVELIQETPTQLPAREMHHEILYFFSTCCTSNLVLHANPRGEMWCSSRGSGGSPKSASPARLLS